MAKDTLSFLYEEKSSNSFSRDYVLHVAETLHISEQELLRRALSTFILGTDIVLNGTVSTNEIDDYDYPTEAQLEAIRAMVSQEPQGPVLSSIFSWQLQQA